MGQIEEKLISDNRAEVTQLQNLFEQNVGMYTLPKMILKDSEKIFQEKYLPSVIRFSVPDESGIEFMDKELQKGRELVKRIVTADFSFLQNVLEDKNFTEAKQVIFFHFDKLDGVENLEDKIKLIKIALDNESDRDGRLLAYGKWVELQEGLSIEESESRAVKELASIRSSLLKDFGGDILDKITLLVLKKRGSILSETLDFLKSQYQQKEDLFKKYLLLDCLLCYVSHDVFAEEEISGYLKWREDEYNGNLYYYFQKHSLKSDFEKTGGEIKLFGKTLFNKIIQHTLPTTSLMAWRKAYESPGMWKQAGFDYVPIEPIVSFRNKDKKYSRVNSAVLGITLWEYERIFGENKSLNQQVDLMEQILNRLRVKYNYKVPQHWHKHNFVLQFERDERGEVDLSREPRIYLIDWDYAVLLNN